jgi:hypothetical protein
MVSLKYFLEKIESSKNKSVEFQIFVSLLTAVCLHQLRKAIFAQMFVRSNFFCCFSSAASLVHSSGTRTFRQKNPNRRKTDDQQTINKGSK